MATHVLKEGRPVRVSYFDTSLMMSLKDIFPNNPTIAADLLEKKKGVSGNIKSIVGAQDNSSAVRKIFRHFIKEVITDIVEGNCMFTFPGAITSELYMGELLDSLVRWKRSEGMLEDFDMSATKYKVPYIKYRFSRNSRKQDLNVYVNKKLYKRLVEVANSGKKFSKRPKNIDHFLPSIYKQFPYIKERSIRKIVKECLKRLARALKEGEEVRVLDGDGEIRFFRPLGKNHDAIMREVVKKRIIRQENASIC